MKFTLLLSAVLFFGMSAVALPHGGAYRGPAGEVPPDSREPSDPPPPPEGGGPTTPGGETGGPTTGGGDIGGPTTGGGDGGGPTSGGGGTAPTSGGGGVGGPSTGAGRSSSKNKGPGYDDWTFWWNFNKDEILGLKDHIRKSRAGTGTAVHVFGRRKSTGGRIKSATRAAIDNKIVPLLREMLLNSDNFDIQGAAAIALAKIGDVSQTATLIEMARNKDNKYHNMVEESAALSLGLLQDPNDEVIAFLLETVMDKSKNASFARPFAAISLGLLGRNDDQMVSNVLFEILAQKETKGDLKPCTLVALGLLGDDTIIDDLMFIIKNGRVDIKGSKELNNIEVSFAIQAVGKIGYANEEMISYFGKRLLAKKTDDHIRRSIAIAFGQIDIDDKINASIVKLLKKAIKDRDDTSTVNFSMISLGKIAARGFERQNIIRVLNFWLNKAKPANLAEPFAALGLGLVGRKQLDVEGIFEPLRLKFDRAANPRTRSGFAVAIGLSKDIAHCDVLADILADNGANKQLRGYSALALGLAGDTSHKAEISEALESEADRGIRVQAAVAAGLVGDYRVVDILIDILAEESSSQYVMGSVALALGQIGDERAIDPLMNIVLDKSNKYPDVTRALTVVALGQLGDISLVPVLSRVAADINFRAIGRVPALTELLTILERLRKIYKVDG